VVVHPDERAPIARLLTFLEHGERMAYECAEMQAGMVSDPGARRFLQSQARQEAAHALVFKGTIAWLAPRQLGESPFLPALEEYRALLRERLAGDDLLETILAEQVILEGLGEAILTHIERGLEKRAAPFVRMRRILLRQEEAHHGFGRRWLERAITRGETDVPTLQRQAHQYLAFSDTMILDLADLFASIGGDPAAWAADVRTFLPDWLRDGTAGLEPVAQS
jgi:hypothetical protein